MTVNDRTFGIEIEMCNVDREKVTLPHGYTWSQDEKIFNTNGRLSKRFGGEVNTPPLRLCQKDRKDLKSIYSSLVAAGGKLKWSIDTHVHIYAGDLTLEQLKSIFYLLYHCYRYIKKYCHISDWDEKVFNAQPIVTDTHYEKVKQAETLSALNNAFANQSQKHYLRLAINIASVFVRKTVEFRCYHATDDFSLVENCVLASYRMFLYAVNHTEEDFKNITSYEEFINVLKLPQNTPPLLVPLIYQGNTYDPKGCFMARPITYNAKLAKVLLDQNIGEISVVGDLDYSFALLLSRKIRTSIYTQNPFTHLLFLLSTGKLTIEYQREMSWLNHYVNKDPVRQVVLAMFTAKVRNFIGSKQVYGITMFNSFKDGIDKSISEMTKSAQELVDFFKSANYHFGNLDDALLCEKTILYQFGHDKHSTGAYQTIKKHSNVDLEITGKDVDYYGLVERIPNEVTFYMFSESPYLSNLNKAAVLSSGDAKSDGRYLYSNKKDNVRKACTASKPFIGLDIRIPPSSLSIDDASKLNIFPIPPIQLHQLQTRFIKKVDKVSLSTFAYVVTYGEHVLGGFGFTFPRGDFADLWQITDFCTNNDIPRLSKFILFCIRSKLIQSDLSRRMGRLVESVITYVYTPMPVSMKYRGEYKKDKELSQPMRLAYKAKLGEYLSKEDIILKYKQVLG